MTILKHRNTLYAVSYIIETEKAEFVTTYIGNLWADHETNAKHAFGGSCWMWPPCSQAKPPPLASKPRQIWRRNLKAYKTSCIPEGIDNVLSPFSSSFLLLFHVFWRHGVNDGMPFIYFISSSVPAACDRANVDVDGVDLGPGLFCPWCEIKSEGVLQVLCLAGQGNPE